MEGIEMNGQNTRSPEIEEMSVKLDKIEADVEKLKESQGKVGNLEVEREPEKTPQSTGFFQKLKFWGGKRTKNKRKRTKLSKRKKVLLK